MNKGTVLRPFIFCIRPHTATVHGLRKFMDRFTYSRRHSEAFCVCLIAYMLKVVETELLKLVGFLLTVLYVPTTYSTQ